MSKRSVIPSSKGDKTFDFLNYTILTIILFVVLYPLYLIIISSFSDPLAVNAGEVVLWFKGFTIDAYQLVFEEGRVWRGYANSILYTGLDVALALALIIPSAYALSRKDLVGRNIFMFMIVFTMFFSGGLIPMYLLVRDLGMLNTIWSLFVPSAVSAFNLIIARTFFQTSIPDELLESAQIDGCSDIKFFFKIVIPLSTPIIAVIALFNAVNQWNAYFPALIYLRDQSLMPLQMILRDIILENEVGVEADVLDPEEAAERRRTAEVMKYALILVASIPMLILYPFLQKYFVKGVMIGSIKG
ncbi:MAG TPA: carbohydrate ABC transporter permease [Pseudogracilibacillus sp.]|nr:carbohydrate ABC transporter permease [Pseudogracilibacillus sp.]